MKENDTDPIFIEALEWFARMKDEQISTGDKHAFMKWIKISPSHADAYKRAEMLWERFDIIKPEYNRMRKTRSLSRRDLLLSSLGFAIIMPGAYVLTKSMFWTDYTTDVGERKTFTLPDGSLVELGSYSALSFDYTPSRRHLTLHRGQGFFSVAPDANRPFIVDAGAGTTKALGTQFDIKRDNNSVTVTVIENRVEVYLKPDQPTEMGEGWQISYSSDVIGRPREADIATVQAWRKDRIIFEDVPLRVVLKELERYRTGKIILLDDTIGEIPVTAVFESKDSLRALEAIAATLSIRVLNPNGMLAVVYR
ncbi:FecR family protein [Brucellaceae bacterium C25G]